MLQMPATSPATSNPHLLFFLHSLSPCIGRGFPLKRANGDIVNDKTNHTEPWVKPCITNSTYGSIHALHSQISSIAFATPKWQKQLHTNSLLHWHWYLMISPTSGIISRGFPPRIHLTHIASASSAINSPELNLYPVSKTLWIQTQPIGRGHGVSISHPWIFQIDYRYQYRW